MARTKTTTQAKAKIGTTTTMTTWVQICITSRARIAATLRAKLLRMATGQQQVLKASQQTRSHRRVGTKALQNGRGPKLLEMACLCCRQTIC